PWRMRHDRRRDGTSDVHRADLAGFVYWHRLDDRRVASLALTVAGFILEDRPHRAHHKLIVEPGCAGVAEQQASSGHRRGPVMQVPPLEFAQEWYGDSGSIRYLGQRQPGCATGATNIRDGNGLRITRVDGDRQEIRARRIERAGQDQRLD